MSGKDTCDANHLIDLCKAEESRYMPQGIQLY